MANARKRKGSTMASMASFDELVSMAQGQVKFKGDGRQNDDNPNRKRIITGDEVRYHLDGEYISVPKGMTYDRIYQVIERLEREQNERQDFLKVFDCRPYDGAYAAAHVLKEMFGITVG